MALRFFSAIAAVAALLTLVQYTVPLSGAGSTMAMAIFAGCARALAPWPLWRRSASGNALSTLRVAYPLFVAGEAALLALVATGVGVGPAFGDVAPGGSAWAATAGWLAIGSLWCIFGYSALRIAGRPWVTAFAATVLVAGILWLTVIGLILWPFVVAAGYVCLAVAHQRTGRGDAAGGADAVRPVPWV